MLSIVAYFICALLFFYFGFISLFLSLSQINEVIYHWTLLGMGGQSNYYDVDQVVW